MNISSLLQQAVQPVAVDAQDTADRVHAHALQPYRLNEVLPMRLGVMEMCRAFAVNGRVMDRSTFHKHERAGKFRRFELHAQIGAKSWSGAKVARFLNGDSFSVAVRRSA